MYLYPSDKFTMELTDVRVHLIALSRWLNSRFLIREGMPVPVIFAAPMDAFAQFSKLWKSPDNPFAYLQELRRGEAATGAVVGRSLEPAQLRFPLISVDWKRMRYRPEQSYASRVNRRLYWPTINSVAEGLKLGDLGNVAQARFPAAWTFTYQIDFWCARPDTQAIFVKQLTNAFKIMSASVPQTFIPVVYPNYVGALAERLILSSDIDDLTDKQPVDTEMQFRTGVTVDIEGYATDNNIVVAPTLWTMMSGTAAVSPSSISVLFRESGVDLRDGPVVNPIVVERLSTMPPPA